MTSVEGTTQQVSGVPRGEHGQHVTARSEQGQFAPLGGSSSSAVKETTQTDASSILERFKEQGGMQNMLKHIEQLEAKLTSKDKALL